MASPIDFESEKRKRLAAKNATARRSATRVATQMRTHWVQGGEVRDEASLPRTNDKVSPQTAWGLLAPQRFGQIVRMYFTPLNTAAGVCLTAAIMLAAALGHEAHQSELRKENERDRVLGKASLVPDRGVFIAPDHRIFRVNAQTPQVESVIDTHTDRLCVVEPTAAAKAANIFPFLKDELQVRDTPYAFPLNGRIECVSLSSLLPGSDASRLAVQDMAAARKRHPIPSFK